MRIRRTLPLAAFVFLALLGGLTPLSVHAGPVTYSVDVSTSSLYGSYGYLDFEFNSAASGAASASAAISNFVTDGILNPTDSNNDSYGVTGSLPSGLTISNQTLNDYFEGFTYGDSISFDVTLSGAAIGSSSGSLGSSFVFSLYDSTGLTPLLTTDPNGTVLTINVDPTSGSTVPVTFPQSPSDSTPAASPTFQPNTAVPEPSTWLMLSIGAAGIWTMRRRLGIANPSLAS